MPSTRARLYIPEVAQRGLVVFEGSLHLRAILRLLFSGVRKHYVTLARS